MGVYKDLQRGTYYVKTKYVKEDGESKWLTKRGFKKRAEAVAWERQYLVENGNTSEVTMAEFAELFLKEKKPRLKGSTVVPMERIIRDKIIPSFGEYELSDIDIRMVTKWQNDLLKNVSAKSGEEYKISYVKKMNDILSAIFNYAKKRRLIKDNPVENSEALSGNATGPMKFWTLEQYKAFAEVAKEDYVASKVFSLLYWTGMREGEMRALTRKDFDFENNLIKISKTMHTYKSKDIITSPKTKKSNREILMPAFLAEEMKEYISKLGNIEDDRLLFYAPPYMLYRRMRKFCKKANLEPIRIHDFRHSHVSLLINLKFNAVDIAERMGHESVDITFKYAHLFPSEQNRMADELDILRKVVLQGE